jgi:hypothetical protein
MNFKQVREIYLFAVVLLVQSIPFLAAAGLAAIERSRLNDYATWQAIEARLGEKLPARLRIGKLGSVAPAVAPAPAVNKHPEAVS